MVTFILGSRDPEMQFIKEVLAFANIDYAFATKNNVPVYSHEAYQADGVDRGIKGYPVFVECEVKHLQPIHIIDHHRPGDPGYNRLPAYYWESSSLGQTIGYLTKCLGVNPELYANRLREYRLAAAADHCLASAYQGECPDVNPADLRMWRTTMRAAFQKIPLEMLLQRIENAKNVLKEAKQVYIENVPVACITEHVPELPEAAAQMGCAFQADLKKGNRPRRNIMSAPAHVIVSWMNLMREKGLKDIYGDPARGFAGAYYK